MLHKNLLETIIKKILINFLQKHYQPGDAKNLLENNLSLQCHNNRN